jgi:hypothetical protein
MNAVLRRIASSLIAEGLAAEAEIAFDQDSRPSVVNVLVGSKP